MHIPLWLERIDMTYFVSDDSINVEYFLSDTDNLYTDLHFRVNSVKGVTKQKANLVNSTIVDGVRRLTFLIELDKGDGVYACEIVRDYTEYVDSNFNFDSVKLESFHVRKITLSSNIVVGAKV